jgi:hypothetical protein
VWDTSSSPLRASGRGQHQDQPLFPYSKNCLVLYLLYQGKDNSTNHGSRDTFRRGLLAIPLAPSRLYPRSSLPTEPLHHLCLYR